MVEFNHHGELREELESYPGDTLSELCYILGLPRSVPKYKKIENILSSEYEYEYLQNKINHLLFGFTILQYFSSRDLKNFIDVYGIQNQRSKIDRMVEIIASNEVSPREMLGVLETKDLRNLFHDITEEETDLNRDGIIKSIIDIFNLQWLEGIKGKGFIIMAITNDPELEGVYHIIKNECDKFDILASRVDEGQSSGSITEEIISEIQNSEYLFVDLTKQRPNVYYELGYAHGSGKQDDKIVLIAKKGEKLHFDIRNLRTIMYKDHDDLKRELNKRLKSIVH